MSSMNWMGCLNHNLQHDASKKPSELPTSTNHYSTSPSAITGWSCILITTCHSSRR